MKRNLLHNDALVSILTQIVVIIILSLLVWLRWERQSAGSFAVGGLICVLPNIYLYRRVFAHFGAHAAKNIVKAFYWGEAVKLVLTAVGFGLALTIPWMRPLWLFVGYIVAQGGFWLAPIVLGLKRQNKNINQNH